MNSIEENKNNRLLERKKKQKDAEKRFFFILASCIFWLFGLFVLVWVISDLLNNEHEELDSNKKKPKTSLFNLLTENDDTTNIDKEEKASEPTDLNLIVKENEK
jgi:hypothetical protein